MIGFIQRFNQSNSDKTISTLEIDFLIIFFPYCEKLKKKWKQLLIINEKSPMALNQECRYQKENE